MFLTVRGATSSEALLATVRDELRQIDPGLPISDARTLRAVVTESTAALHGAQSTMGLFAIVALGLSAIGIYGVVAYSVKQREREFGIRMALGALPRQVIKVVLGHGVAIGLIGIAAGFPLAVLITHLLSALVFGAGISSIATLIAVPLLLTVVLVLACYIPARLATRVDPMKCLRCE